VFLFLAFSFLWNDLIDYFTGKDFYAHPDRALPSGRLRPAVAAGAIVCLLAVAALLATLLPPGGMLRMGVFFGLSGIYSFGLKQYFPIFATPLWCGVVSALAVYCVGGSTPFFILIFIYLYIREITLDARDAAADARLAVLKTLPDLVGPLGMELIVAMLAATGLAVALGMAAPVASIVSLLILSFLLFSFFLRWTPQKTLRLLGHAMLPGIALVLFV
jgi:4-hydroxybenzoate polyprenyltransferase